MRHFLLMRGGEKKQKRSEAAAWTVKWAKCHAKILFRIIKARMWLINIALGSRNLPMKSFWIKKKSGVQIEDLQIRQDFPLENITGVENCSKRCRTLFPLILTKYPPPPLLCCFPEMQRMNVQWTAHLIAQWSQNQIRLGTKKGQIGLWKDMKWVTGEGWTARGTNRLEIRQPGRWTGGWRVAYIYILTDSVVVGRTETGGKIHGPTDGKTHRWMDGSIVRQRDRLVK